MTDDYLTEQETAEFIGVSLDTLRRELKRAPGCVLLNPRRIHRRLKLFRKCDVIAFIEAKATYTEKELAPLRRLME